MSWYNYSPYVSVKQKKAEAERLIEKLRRENPDLRPVCVTGRLIARTFWGQAWGKHLETYADHENRIERGRSYVRANAVCHLEVAAGLVNALVSGSQSQPYQVRITIRPLSPDKWRAIKSASAGKISSMLDLLTGKFPQELMAQVSDPENGLFPKLGELKFNCGCPDWAQMCKHVAAALYALGHRFDQEPELLFLMRGVDPAELVSLEALAATAVGPETVLKDADLAGLFGIELELGASNPRPKAAPQKAPAGSRSKARLKSPAAPKAVARPLFFKNPQRPKGREIAALRKHLHLTRGAFAARLEISPASAGRWEKEKVPALQKKSRDKLIALAAELGGGA